VEAGGRRARRLTQGARRIREELFQAAGDENTIMNVMRRPDRGSAESFLADPSLPEAMARAGVTGTPPQQIHRGGGLLTARPHRQPRRTPIPAGRCNKSTVAVDF
jgi:hypothetical protein